MPNLRPSPLHAQRARLEDRVAASKGGASSGPVPFRTASAGPDSGLARPGVLARKRSRTQNLNIRRKASQVAALRRALI